VEVVLMGRFYFPSVFLFLSLSANAVCATVVVNELYYDHPGSDTGYEFIELFNTDASAVPLEGARIEFHNGAASGWDVIWTGGAGHSIEGGALFVVGGAAVQPLPDDVSDLGLQNGPDAVRLVLAGQQADLVGYGGLDDPQYVESEAAAPVASGRSLSRIPDGNDHGHNAEDFHERIPSPGFLNLPRNDVALLPGTNTPRADVRELAGVEALTVAIANNGLSEIEANAVMVTLAESTATGIRTLDERFNDGAIRPEGAALVAFSIPLGDGYHWLSARSSYELDERASNDTLRLVRRVGGPKLLVSEVLSDPAGDCPQMVELFNFGDGPVSVGGFHLRDKAGTTAAVSSGSVLIPPGGYLALTSDRSTLLLCHPGAPDAAETLGSWPRLNRTGSLVADSVIVSDRFRLQIDAVAYPPQPSSARGVSLERVDLYPRPGGPTWLLSQAPSGASPGRGHDRALTEPATQTVEVHPAVFAPYDGESLIVTVSPAPETSHVRASVYDIGGRVVAELGAATSFPAVFVWSGRTEGGDIAAPGHYIVACAFRGQDGSPAGSERVVIGCARR